MTLESECSAGEEVFGFVSVAERVGIEQTVFPREPIALEQDQFWSDQGADLTRPSIPWDINDVLSVALSIIALQ